MSVPVHLIREALADAIAYRTPGECTRCTVNGWTCSDHAWDGKQAAAYRELLNELSEGNAA